MRSWGSQIGLTSLTSTSWSVLLLQVYPYPSLQLQFWYLYISLHLHRFSQTLHYSSTRIDWFQSYLLHFFYIQYSCQYTPWAREIDWISTPYAPFSILSPTADIVLNSCSVEYIFLYHSMWDKVFQLPTLFWYSLRYSSCILIFSGATKIKIQEEYPTQAWCS